MSKKRLTIQTLIKEAKRFSEIESTVDEPSLYGVTNGKAVGTYFEHKFQAYLQERYVLPRGNSAKGIDFPGLEVDMKVTSIKQPQSSCPFKTARQKIFGLGYSLLVFVYDKKDDAKTRSSRLNVVHTIFIQETHTADYQTTKELRRLAENSANEEEIIAFMHDRCLPVDDIEATRIAQDILQQPPTQGYLTISNALQWRLQYGRAISVAGTSPGVIRVR